MKLELELEPADGWIYYDDPLVYFHDNNNWKNKGCLIYTHPVNACHVGMVITLSNSNKWNDIFVVDPEEDDCPVYRVKNVHEVIDPKWDSKQSMVFDHLWHPEVLSLISLELKAAVCSRSYEMLMGRWIMEYLEREEDILDPPSASCTDIVFV